MASKKRLVSTAYNGGADEDRTHDLRIANSKSPYVSSYFLIVHSYINQQKQQVITIVALFSYFQISLRFLHSSYMIKLLRP